jgi:hypothetical protein
MYRCAGHESGLDRRRNTAILISKQFILACGAECTCTERQYLNATQDNTLGSKGR